MLGVLLICGVARACFVRKRHRFPPVPPALNESIHEAEQSGRYV